MDALLQNAGLLNLFAGALVALSAALILRFRTSIRSQPFIHAAFLFWLLEWVAFVLIYVAFANVPADLHLGLMFVDLSGLFALGFSLIFMRGTAYENLGNVFLEITAVFLALLVWNFSFRDLNQASDLYRQIWIIPSKTVAAAAFVMSAHAFWKRYGLASLPVVSVSLIYLVLQHPLYRVVFVDLKPASGGWFLSIAVGKIFYAVTFYAVFLSPATTFESVPLIPSWPGAGWGGRLAKIALTLISGLGAAFAADLVVKVLFKLLESR